MPCLIKNPPLGGLPQREPESFSPIALGLSMRIDYARRELIMARELSPLSHDTELPLRMYRLATVRGIVNGRPATFVIDTGGEVISISSSTAGGLDTPKDVRRIPLKVYGTSGWDKDAFLLPNVDLDFNSIAMLHVGGRTLGPHPHDVARIQGQARRHVDQEIHNAKDHVVGRESDQLLVVQPDLGNELFKIYVCFDPRTHWLERVGVL